MSLMLFPKYIFAFGILSILSFRKFLILVFEIFQPKGKSEISEELKSVLENYKIREGTSAYKSLKKLIQAVEKYATKNIRNFKTLDLNPVVIDKNSNALALDALIMMEK